MYVNQNNKNQKRKVAASIGTVGGLPGRVDKRFHSEIDTKYQ